MSERSGRDIDIQQEGVKMEMRNAKCEQQVCKEEMNSVHQDVMDPCLFISHHICGFRPFGTPAARSTAESCRDA